VCCITQAVSYCAIELTLLADLFVRENFRAVFQLLDNFCFVIDPLADYSIEVLHCYIFFVKSGLIVD